MTDVVSERSYVRDADAYRESMRDGRVVYYKGKVIDDVVTHPATGGGVETIADLYADQFRPETQDLLTYVRDDGARVTASYFVPRTKEDLRWRRAGIEYVARKTFGTHGRGIDMISTSVIGLVSEHPKFERACPEFSDNIFRYRQYAEENNIHLAATIVDPQGYRARASGTADTESPPERATLRIVKENEKGVWISGLKGVGTAAPQANEIIVGGFHTPLDEESIWAVVPAGAEGIRMYCRELVHQPGAELRDHPLDGRGEEMEALVCFDNVFIERDRIFAMKNRSVHGVNFYNVWARHEHWYTFVRLMAKAKLLAGLAQLIVDTLELGEVPVVRQRVSKVFEYAAILEAIAVAAEETAQLSEGEVLVPDEALMSAGRAYGLHHYPEILHTLQDISGQGLIFRFSDEDFDSPAAFEQKLGWFLDTRSVSARDKNLVMNLVWDATASSHATRVKLFEESNALNVPLLLERVYNEYDRSDAMDHCRYIIGLGPAPKLRYEHEIAQTWSERKARGDY